MGGGVRGGVRGRVRGGVRGGVSDRRDGQKSEGDSKVCW